MEKIDNYIDPIESKVPFETMISLGSGGTPRTSNPDYWNGYIPFFSPKDATGCYVHKTEKNITVEGLNNCNSALYPENTTFITARGTVGKICLTAEPMAMNQSCYAVISKTESRFTTYLLCLNIVEKLKHKASGAVFDAITAQDILEEQIPLINPSVLKQLEYILAPFFTTIHKNGLENQTLVETRSCLLDKLIKSAG